MRVMYEQRAIYVFVQGKTLTLLIACMLVEGEVWTLLIACMLAGGDTRRLSERLEFDWLRLDPHLI